jgi:hypothetical protein
MKIVQEIKNQVKSYRDLKVTQYLLWKQRRSLSRAINLANATSLANNGIQFHVFKIGNKYHVNRRLDFKLSKQLSTKEKDRINVIKLRESAIYSTPLCSVKERELREKELKDIVVSLPLACLIFSEIKTKGVYQRFNQGKWEREMYIKNSDMLCLEYKENMIYAIRLGNVKHIKEENKK